jgi:uncharacterized protein (DUF427 family)
MLILIEVSVLNRRPSEMAKAIWNNIVIAESDETIIVEGNHYFPQSAVNQAYINENSYNLPLASGKA